MQNMESYKTVAQALLWKFSPQNSASFSFLLFSLTETECDLPFIWFYLSNKLPTPWECIFSWFPIVFKYTRGFCFVCFWSEVVTYWHFSLNWGEECLIKTDSFYYMTFQKAFYILLKIPKKLKGYCSCYISVPFNFLTPLFSWNN